jgi:hypothetical protein
MNNTGLAQDTKVIGLPERIPLQGIQAVQVVYSANAATLTMDLQGVVTDVQGTPVFRMRHPEAGDWRKITSVTYEDGTSWP